MTKTLNQQSLRINSGSGENQPGNHVSLRIENGESKPGKYHPVFSIGKVISMPPGKEEGRLFPRELSACFAGYMKNDRKNFDIDFCTLKGGGEYSLKSSIQHTYQPKLQMEKKNHEI
jgi:hypothetical protein